VIRPHAWRVIAAVQDTEANRNLPISQTPRNPMREMTSRFRVDASITVQRSIPSPKPTAYILLPNARPEELDTEKSPTPAVQLSTLLGSARLAN
jgi:hypothetical protein